jgi:hypothetical protein
MQRRWAGRPADVLIAMATPAGRLELQRMLEEVGR